MPPKTPTSDASPGTDLAALVDTTRRRLRATRLWLAGASAVAALVAFLLLAAAADMLLPLSVGMRVATFVSLIAILVAAVTAAAWCCFAAPSAGTVARRIEALFPAMHNRLITVLDLRRRTQGPADPVYAPFEARLIEQTRRLLAPFRPRYLTDSCHLARTITAAVALLLLAPVMLVLFSSRMPTALARILAPTADIAPITGLAFRAQPGDIDALEGEAVTLVAVIERGRTDALEVQLRDAASQSDAATEPRDAAWHRYPMSRKADGRFTFALAKLDRSYEYRIAGGRTWSPVYRVNLVRRPMIEHIEARVHLPAYMGIGDPIQTPADSIVAPTGAEVELIATSRGESSAGLLKLLTFGAAGSQESDDIESVWIDDAIPADAHVIGHWSWRGDIACSGSKSHGFDRTQSPYGLRTRLSPLVLGPDSSFFVYARPDRDNPPHQLIVTLTVGTSSFELTWGAPAPSASTDAATRTIHLGPMPAARGGWSRLEAPLASILGVKPSGQTRITGITFAIDRGQVFLDRVGGLVRRPALPPRIAAQVDREIAMRRDDAGRWSGRITLAHDTHLTVELTNAHGHTSAAMKPLPVTVRPDAPPWLHLEKPGRAVTLARVQAVPMAVRAFDDYGLAAVGWQVSRDVDAFSAPVKWAESWDEPLTSRHVVTAIEPVDDQGKALQLGEAFFCRAVARDRKGQLGFGEPVRIAFIADQATPETRPPDHPDELAALLQQFRAYAEQHRQLGDDAATQPAPTMVTQALRELDARLARQRMAAAQLARRLDDQAATAERSPLASDLEDDVLRLLADQMLDLADTPDTLGATDSAMIDRLTKLRQEAPKQQEQLAEMLRQLKALAAARERMASDPKQAQQTFEELLAQLRGQGAARELARLADALEYRQQAIARLEAQQAALAGRPAEDRSLASTDDEQRKLDKQAIVEVAKAQDLLRRRKDDAKPLEAWEPTPHVDAQDEAHRTARHEELRRHQQQVAGELRQNRGDLSSAIDQAVRLAQSLRQASSRDDKSELQSVLASSAMKSMMSMAGRARSQAIEEAELAGGRASPDNPGQPAGRQNAPSLRRGEVLPASTRRIDPTAGPALYRLPPQLRDAILGGINEQGPPGYQPLIDAYYRQLTEGMK